MADLMNDFLCLFTRPFSANETHDVDRFDEDYYLRLPTENPEYESKFNNVFLKLSTVRNV